MIPTPSSLVLFLSAALLLLVIPGPAVFYIVGRSIGHGRGAGLVSALGIGVGSLVHTAAAAVGLSALLMSSALAFEAVKYLGAAYLVYLGVQKFRCEEPFELSDEAPSVKLGRIFAQGIVVNVLNPKAALFFFAFLPQFVDANRGSVAAQIFFLGVLFALLGVTTDTLWALTAGTLANLFKHNPRAIRTQRYISGGMLISLGLATAFAGSSTRK
jgi:threonine/homoserine/homoserine lactone efflux protein